MAIALLILVSIWCVIQIIFLITMVLVVSDLMLYTFTGNTLNLGSKLLSKMRLRKLTDICRVDR